MGWLGNAIGSIGGYLGGGAGKVSGLLTGAAGGLIGGKAEDSVSQQSSPHVTGFDPTKDLSKENHLPGQNYFDESIDKELIPAQWGRDANYFGKTLNEGIDPKAGNGMGLIAPQGLGSANDPTIAAINNQQQALTSTALRGITTRNQEQGKVDAANQQNTVAHEAAAEYQTEVANFQQQYAYQMQRYQLKQQYEQAQNQAQASLWGSVFGGIGKIGGAVLGAKG